MTDSAQYVSRLSAWRSHVCPRSGADEEDPVLSRFCIPAPLIGGLCFTVFNTILYATGTAVITFDDTLQTVFMIMFFTTVGFTVSIPLLFKSGKAVIMLLILSIVMIILQNAVGSGVMALMGKNPLFGLACGSISMIGGPGTAAGIGPDLDAAGAIGGTTVAVAAATFGLIFGSLLGGPIARKLIVKNHLRDEVVEQVTEEDADDAHFNTHSNNFVYGFLLLVFCVGVGNIVSVRADKGLRLQLPDLHRLDARGRYRAQCHRPLQDHGVPHGGDRHDGQHVPRHFPLDGALGPQACWQLVDLALPMIVALAAEVLLMVVFSLLVVFPVMGRDYDAAIIRRLHRLRHGRHVQRQCQHAGRFAATVPLPRPTSSSRWWVVSSTIFQCCDHRFCHWSSL